MTNLYFKLSDYYKQLGFQARVQKITVDAGFSCPNRDGSLSKEGCVFCSNEAFSPAVSIKHLSLKEQIKSGILQISKKYGECKYVAYFQAYTNTYAPVEKLKQVYNCVLEFKDIVGISIGTRPDCLDEEKLKLINSYAQNYDVWLELGLQSIFDDTLKAINRGHDYQTFKNAVELVKKFPKIKICTHVILGLNGEGEKEAVQTAKELARLGINGVKLHPLHVVKNTPLETLFKNGSVKIQSEEEYVSCAVQFLENINPKMVIHRLGADCSKELLVAPQWVLNKNATINKIENALKENKSFQGKFYG